MQKKLLVFPQFYDKQKLVEVYGIHRLHAMTEEEKEMHPSPEMQREMHRQFAWVVAGHWRGAPGPITFMSSKSRRLTIFECTNDIPTMLDLAKVAAGGCLGVLKGVKGVCGCVGRFGTCLVKCSCRVFRASLLPEARHV